MFGPLPFGMGGTSGAGVAFNLLDAVVVATNCLRVTASVKFLQQFPTGVHDSLNTSNWNIQRTAGAFAYQILTVVPYDEYSVDIFIIGYLSNQVTSYSVSAANVHSKTGQSLATTTTLPFVGVYVAGDLTVDRSTAVDLRNFATPRNPVGGTLIIGTDGDYAEMSGDEFLIKMITRRLTTKRGEFFHAPDYGLGIPAKSILTGDALLNLRVSIERDVAKEPEVAAVKAAVSLQNGVVSVQVTATTKTSGSTVTTPVMQF